MPANRNTLWPLNPTFPNLTIGLKGAPKSGGPDFGPAKNFRTNIKQSFCETSSCCGTRGTGRQESRASRPPSMPSRTTPHEKSNAPAIKSISTTTISAGKPQISTLPATPSRVPCRSTAPGSGTETCRSTAPRSGMETCGFIQKNLQPPGYPFRIAGWLAISLSKSSLWARPLSNVCPSPGRPIFPTANSPGFPISAIPNSTDRPKWPV